jgi:hypothetical protein
MNPGGEHRAEKSANSTHGGKVTAVCTAVEEDALSPRQDVTGGQRFERFYEAISLFLEYTRDAPFYLRMVLSASHGPAPPKPMRIWQFASSA